VLNFRELLLACSTEKIELGHSSIPIANPFFRKMLAASPAGVNQPPVERRRAQPGADRDTNQNGEFRYRRGDNDIMNVTDER